MPSFTAACAALLPGVPSLPATYCSRSYPLSQPSLQPSSHRQKKAPIRVWCSRDTTQEQLQAGLLAHMRLPLASETKMYKRVLEYERTRRSARRSGWLPPPPKRRRPARRSERRRWGQRGGGAGAAQGLAGHSACATFGFIDVIMVAVDSAPGRLADCEDRLSIKGSPRAVLRWAEPAGPADGAQVRGHPPAGPCPASTP